MATYGEWRKHFEKTSEKHNKRILRAINALSKDKMIQKEYGWTGILRLPVPEKKK